MDQLDKIFDIIGTPSAESWPENAVVLRSNFRSKAGKDLASVVPEIDPDTHDLIKVII